MAQIPISPDNYDLFPHKVSSNLTITHIAYSKDYPHRWFIAENCNKGNWGFRWNFGDDEEIAEELENADYDQDPDDSESYTPETVDFLFDNETDAVIFKLWLTDFR